MPNGGIFAELVAIPGFMAIDQNMSELKLIIGIIFVGNYLLFTTGIPASAPHGIAYRGWLIFLANFLVISFATFCILKFIGNKVKATLLIIAGVLWAFYAVISEPLAKWPCYPNSALCEKFYPRNIEYMPVEKFLACLDFELKFSFCKRLIYLVFSNCISQSTILSRNTNSTSL